MRRIRSFEKWVRSNPVALKPRSLAISLSQPYKCQRQTSSLSILGLKVHSTSKLVRRIRSFEKWVRSNPVALKPRSIAISLSRPYKCQRQTSSLSILGLEVQPCLSEPSRTCNVLISAVVRCSSFSATLTWRRGNASCGSLGSLADLYSRHKV